ncbi:MAG TPA: DUF4149 domain-containing protein [Candidatus Kapabacteria bacterium]|jgi:hypothetical protein
MVLTIIKSLALGVWLGALLMLGYAVAGPIFQHSPSKTLAGTINGIILGRMNAIEWVCAVLALVASILSLLLHWQSSHRTLQIVETVTILIAAIILWMYSISITNRMDTLRATIGDFDHPQTTSTTLEAKQEFDTLHHRYTALVSVNMLLILSGFTLSILNGRE